jgi:hypothetical protein
MEFLVFFQLFQIVPIFLKVLHLLFFSRNFPCLPENWSQLVLLVKTLSCQFWLKGALVGLYIPSYYFLPWRVLTC